MISKAHSENPAVKTRILVTGASGFVGTNLCRELYLSGEYEIFALVRGPRTDEADGVGMRSIAYDRNLDSLIENITANSIEGIVHLASLFLARHSGPDVDRLIEANITLGAHLLESASRSGVRWFLNTSSFWQHFEGRRYSPVALYAATKQAFEDIMKYYVETTGMGFLTLELFDTYGPGDKRNKLFRLLRHIVEAGDTLAMSPGDQLMNLVYVGDVVEAYRIAIKALNLGERGLAEKYSVSAAKLCKLRDVLHVYEEVVGKRLNIGWGERAYREREVMSPLPVHEALPGWQPVVDLEAGIRKMCRIDGLII